MTLPLTGAGPSAGAEAPWTPASPTTDGSVSPHTWHYAGSGGLWQESAKSTPATSDGDPVGASVNQGSDSHDIVQATSANKPTLKLAILNGEPVFRCDGGDFLKGTFDGATTQPATVLVVAQLGAGAVNDGNTRTILAGDDGGAPDRVLIDQDSVGTPDNWRVLAATPLDGGDSDGDWNTWLALLNGASGQYWLNGVSEASGNIGNDAPDVLTMGARSGGGNQWVGDIAEFLIYDFALSDADKNQLGNYLATKYGLPWTAIT